jgi:hypothetical protein
MLEIMKTNQIMIRKMGEFEVHQRTMDGMFDGNHLLRQWNAVDGNPQRQIDRFLSSAKTKEFIEAISKDIGETKKAQLPDIQVGAKMLKPDNQVVTKTAGRTLKDGSKVPEKVWMHPYLFIDFAMWINPTFKLEVIKFVHDSLISVRHSAGDNYKNLASWLSTFQGVDFKRVAKAMNHIVFGKHESGTLRQNATEEKLKELDKLQSQIAFSIEMGHIKTYGQLIKELKLIWWRNQQAGKYGTIEEQASDSINS